MKQSIDRPVSQTFLLGGRSITIWARYLPELRLWEPLLSVKWHQTEVRVVAGRRDHRETSAQAMVTAAAMASTWIENQDPACWGPKENRSEDLG